VVYAAATNVSVGRMFLAGIIPGIILGVMMMVCVYFAARHKKIPLQPRASLREIIAAGADAIWGLLLIFVIMGGIYSGAFTPTEAAAVAVIYALIVAVVIYRDLTWLEVPKVLVEAGKVTVMLMFIIANAFLF